MLREGQFLAEQYRRGKPPTYPGAWNDETAANKTAGWRVA
jgi:hypothetical protein